ncbi:hypothetical protein F5882DRAFT_378751 [Hyaloscypha sp. PMI_1271]|nr:hypothetical protein F5882DRAFT_378751 [Hyaloscypha sp. PMI_1271]
MSDEDSAATGSPGGEKRAASSPITNLRSSTGLNTKKRAVPQKYYEAFKIAYPEYKALADEFYRRVFYLRIMGNELKEFGKIDAIEVEDWDKFVALYAQVHRPVLAAILKKETCIQGSY